MLIAVQRSSTLNWFRVRSPSPLPPLAPSLTNQANFSTNFPISFFLLYCIFSFVCSLRLPFVCLSACAGGGTAAGSGRDCEEMRRSCSHGNQHSSALRALCSSRGVSWLLSRLGISMRSALGRGREGDRDREGDREGEAGRVNCDAMRCGPCWGATSTTYKANEKVSLC